jgi:hypothetical protein
MNLPELPELDHSDLDALQSSAAYRAEVAVNIADSPIYWKGMELKLTVSTKSLLYMLMRQDGSLENGDHRNERDTLILLYLCSQKPEVWSKPEVTKDGILQPRRSRPNDWLLAIDEWADNAVKPHEIAEATEVIDRLWAVNHAPRVVPDNEDTLEPLGNGQTNQAGSLG